MPEEPYGRERVFDIPDEPTPFVPPAPKQSAPQAAPQPKPAAAPAPASGGDGDVWNRLLDHYKGRLMIHQRPFLNMAKGILEGDCLVIWCPTDFIRDSLSAGTIPSVLQEVTSADVGRPVRIEFKVGDAPKTAATAKPKAQPVSAPAPAPAQPVKAAAPQETPPWEEPPKAKDRLDELMAPAQKLESFKIK